MRFPLNKTKVFVTSDSDSFKLRDFSIETEIPVGEHCGAFGSQRSHDVHTGVDLYCVEGDTVVAMEPGTVVLIEHFTGVKADSPWWMDTMAVHVEGASGVLVYGEIEPERALHLGQSLLEGQLIGTVKRVLQKDKGRPLSMLHMELYKHGSRQSCIWSPDKPRSTNLLNPTDLLIKAVS